MAADGPGEITYAAVRNSLVPPMDKTNFRRNILGHPDWQEAIADRPYNEANFGRSGRQPGLRRDAFEEHRAAA